MSSEDNNDSSGELDEGSQIPTHGATTEHRLKNDRRNIAYQAVADWLTLHKIHRPIAKMFHVAYLADETDVATRPLTFVFNGGPGAASAFLHMGALGPQRVEFGDNGSLPPPPASVVDNHESWLPFTDLVFIDPLGTGFSRAISTEGSKDSKQKENPSPSENKEFWEIDRDIESLGEFITRFLSIHHRWTSPIFIAGESYGGFRVAKMARALQQDHGVGLCGAMLISPAIEFDGLFGSDYNLTHWIEVFPSLVAAAHHHGRSSIPIETPIEQVTAMSAEFATTELARWLSAGDHLPEHDRRSIIARMSELCGLSQEFLDRSSGRVTSSAFCRELLRDDSRLLGRYDASVSAADPFRDRETYQGPDPTLFSIDRLFSAAINQHLRANLKVVTELDYRLLSMEVNQDWKNKAEGRAFRGADGAMDDLRYGMSLNEHMNVFVTHGYFDLITPFFASQRLSRLMKLSDAQQEQLTLKNYRGGHMFYSWDDSRIAFTQDTRAFFAASTR